MKLCFVQGVIRQRAKMPEPGDRRGVRRQVLQQSALRRGLHRRDPPRDRTPVPLLALPPHRPPPRRLSDQQGSHHRHGVVSVHSSYFPQCEPDLFILVQVAIKAC